MGYLIMTFAPATAIKLSSSTQLGALFNSVRTALDKPVAEDYLHISTSFINSTRMSASQELEYKKIVGEAAGEMAKIQFFNTGEITVTTAGYVLLEILSPEIEKIKKKMQANLLRIGLPAVDKTTPIHATLRAGKYGNAITPVELSRLQGQVSSSAMQRLKNARFSLDNAEFGAISYIQGKAAIIPDWAHTVMAPAPTPTALPAIVGTYNVPIEGAASESTRLKVKQAVQDRLKQFENDKGKIQSQFIAQLTKFKTELDSDKTKRSPSTIAKGNELYQTLLSAQQKFFASFTLSSTPGEVAYSIKKFKEICATNVKQADSIMGHGWLYRGFEVLIKAVVGLFAAIGMTLGTLAGQGLYKADHREAFKTTFFTLNKTNLTKALEDIRKESLEVGGALVKAKHNP